MRTFRVTVVLLLVVVLFPNVLPRTSDAQGDDPALQAREVVAGILSRIDTVVGNAEDGPAAKRALVEREIDSHLDYGRLARAALGPLAERFSQRQIADFAREYSRYLGYMLLQQAATDKPARSEIVGASYDGPTGRAVVRTTGEVGLLDFVGRSDGMPTRLRRDFTLKRVYGQWRIVGLEFNGVDVSKNFRAQFQAILARSDPAELITKLRVRNEANDLKNPFERTAR